MIPHFKMNFTFLFSTCTLWYVWFNTNNTTSSINLVFNTVWNSTGFQCVNTFAIIEFLVCITMLLDLKQLQNPYYWPKIWTCLTPKICIWWGLSKRLVLVMVGSFCDCVCLSRYKICIVKTYLFCMVVSSDWLWQIVTYQWYVVCDTLSGGTMGHGGEFAIAILSLWLKFTKFYLIPVQGIGKLLFDQFWK